MKKYVFNLKYVVLGAIVSLASCVNDDLPEVGDLPDLTGPKPFYNYTDATTAVFDCSDVEQEVKYDYFFQAGSNLAVNGIYYDWTVTPAEGVTGDVVLINKEKPVLEQMIAGELAVPLSIEAEIEKIKFKLPCETDPAKITVMEQQVADLEVQLAEAEAAVTEETRQTVADLEAQIAALPEATLQDQELIFEFPQPGEYTVALKVTDNLGKSETTDKLVTVNQAVPTIAIPEISEAGFEDNDLFDGTGDGRDSWRAPSNSAWSPLGGGTTVPQINANSELGRVPEGLQAAKFPSDGGRVAYQKIEVTPGATYVLSYFTAFNVDNYGEVNVSILKPETASYTEAQLEDNIIAFRTDNTDGRVSDVFKKHAITFEAGDNEEVIIFVTNSGDEFRLDAFDITVKQ